MGLQHIFLESYLIIHHAEIIVKKDHFYLLILMYSLIIPSILKNLH